MYLAYPTAQLLTVLMIAKVVTQFSILRTKLFILAPTFGATSVSFERIAARSIFLLTVREIVAFLRNRAYGKGKPDCSAGFPLFLRYFTC
jgi:hypothetical protein